MSELEKYLPSDDEISKAFEHDYHECQYPDAKEYCPEFKRLIRAAVERAVADEKEKVRALVEGQIRRWEDAEGLTKLAMSEHAREVEVARLEAKIEALEEFRVEVGNETGIDEALALWLDEYRAQLAALDAEVE